MTPAFGGQYSIQLSYGRLLLINMLCAKHADIRKHYGNQCLIMSSICTIILQQSNGHDPVLRYGTTNSMNIL